MRMKIPPFKTEEQRDAILKRMLYRVICLLIIGAIFFFIEVNLYRNTIIKWPILLCIWIFPSLLISFFTSELWFRFIYTKKFRVRFIGNTIFFGGLFSMSFLAINNSASNEDLKAYKFKILHKSFVDTRVSRHRWERSALAYINYFGQTKELVFSYQDTELVEDADSVIVSVYEGTLGYDIINNIYLSSSKKQDEETLPKMNSDIPVWNSK